MSSLFSAAIASLIFCRYRIFVRGEVEFPILPLPMSDFPIVIRLTRSSIPEHHRPTAVLAFRNDSFESPYSNGWSSTYIDVCRQGRVMALSKWPSSSIRRLIQGGNHTEDAKLRVCGLQMKVSGDFVHALHDAHWSLESFAFPILGATHSLYLKANRGPQRYTVCLTRRLTFASTPGSYVKRVRSYGEEESSEEGTD